MSLKQNFSFTLCKEDDSHGSSLRSIAVGFYAPLLTYRFRGMFVAVDHTHPER